MSEPTSQAVLAEPFGQQSATVMVMPLVSCVALILLAVCATMWYRSYVVADRFGKSEGTTEWIVQSSYGRILIARLDYSTSIDVGSRAWTFQSRSMTPVRVDPWEPSLGKLMGIEYRGSSLSALAAGGWWLRVKWPTLLAVAAVIPLWRVLAKARKRGGAKDLLT